MDAQTHNAKRDNTRSHVSMSPKILEEVFEVDHSSYRLPTCIQSIVTYTYILVYSTQKKYLRSRTFALPHT
jgi:hypothetical protein